MITENYVIFASIICIVAILILLIIPIICIIKAYKIRKNKYDINKALTMLKDAGYTYYEWDSRRLQDSSTKFQEARIWKKEIVIAETGASRKDPYSGKYYTVNKKLIGYSRIKNAEVVYGTYPSMTAFENFIKEKEQEAFKHVEEIIDDTVGEN